MMNFYVKKMGKKNGLSIKADEKENGSFLAKQSDNTGYSLEDRGFFLSAPLEGLPINTRTST